MSPSGEVQYYDKRHTFTLAGEDQAYASGENDGIVTYKKLENMLEGVLRSAISCLGEKYLRL